MKKLLFATVAASFFVAGCAAPQTTTAASERLEGDVTTGSRIPRKDNPQATKVIIQDDMSRSEMTRSAPQQNPKGG